MITVYGDSRTGLVRKINEDCIFTDAASIFLLADGMGGYEGGKVASSIAIETAKKFLSGLALAISIESLKDSIEIANAKVLAEKAKENGFSNMGTTMISAALETTTFSWAYVGDSRIYVYRNNRLDLLTTDHSFVMELLKEGTITQAEMKNHPRRNEITRAVGIVPYVDVDTGTILLETDDIVLLCSDGLSSVISDENIASVIAAYKEDSDMTLKVCGEKLFSLVYEAGAPDNVSMILIDYEDDGVKDD